jgi:hypothetical protein
MSKDDHQEYEIISRGDLVMLRTLVETDRDHLLANSQYHKLYLDTILAARSWMAPHPESRRRCTAKYI